MKNVLPKILLVIMNIGNIFALLKASIDEDVFNLMLVFMIIYSFLAITDFILGILKAKKHGEKISSWKMYNTPVKITLATSGMIVLAIISSHIPYLGIPLFVIVSGLIVLMEIKSINEKSEGASGEDNKSIDVLDNVINLLKSIFDKFKNK